MNVFHSKASFFLDGIREKDRVLFSPTLTSVANWNKKDNSYYLKKHLYQSEVKPNWPGYSDQDRVLLKRYDLSLIMEVSKIYYGYSQCVFLLFEYDNICHLGVASIYKYILT